jgi:ubiquinone/menaquinone biosynthesis C-methylase UbiE
MNYPWDNYFGTDLSSFLQGKMALDIGCFTGGRSVAWFERYKLKHITGIDIRKLFIESAKQFASIHNISADFKVSYGESLPFENETFDAILTFDVFEHVKNIKKTLNECHRVLKIGGKLFLSFPSYFHPIGHHLDVVTKTPCIHWFFSGRTYIRAFNEIIEERGEKAYWYKRSSTKLESWERGNTMNGTTLYYFKTLIKGTKWRIILFANKPIGSIGRNVSRSRFIGIVSKLFSPLTKVPGLQEIFLHRITYILEKC